MPAFAHAVPEPQVLRLAELAAFQPGSVVSRQLVKKPTGTVTLFAFAEGEGLSEHTAPFDAMVHVLDGEAEVVIAGTPFRLTAGDAIVMPANRPHALRAVKAFRMLLTMIRSE
jgi:quercetin dioxygenase-like cupin family protein